MDHVILKKYLDGNCFSDTTASWRQRLFHLSLSSSWGLVPFLSVIHPPRRPHHQTASSSTDISCLQEQNTGNQVGVLKQEQEPSPPNVQNSCPNLNSLFFVTRFQYYALKGKRNTDIYWPGTVPRKPYPIEIISTGMNGSCLRL